MNIVRHPASRLATLPIASEHDRFRPARDVERFHHPREDAPRASVDAGRVLFTPDVDVTETRDAYVFAADLPGVREDDLEIAVAGDRLTLSGRRDEARHPERATYFNAERSYGAFRRDFILPAEIDLDGLRAELRDGVLTVSIPKGSGVAYARGAIDDRPPPP